MGLLEKAESGNEPEKKSRKKAEKKPPAKAEPTPQKKKEAPKRESRFSRRKDREKKAKEPKPVADLPSFPDGFEQPTSGQMAFRRLVDILVGYGWMFPVVGIFAWGSDFDATYFLSLIHI